MKRIGLISLLVVFFVSNAMAADNSMFNYQGRVLVQGIPYTGTGRMKVAILATTGTSSVASIWSNDGTSVGGLEPTNSFDVSVTAGVFDVMIGDASAGMAVIPAIMFNRDDELKVRVWFNDGVHGYQQLTPDRRLTHPRRLGITEVHSETTLYVNGTTGNDLNSGLTPTTGPKKTIQAAINMVPARLFKNITINVANGIYRESVAITGITAEYPYYLRLLGDSTTVPTDTVSPNVRLTGTDNDTNHAKVRSMGIRVLGCNNVEINGFLIDYFTDHGIWFHHSQAMITNCKSSYNMTGYYVSTSSVSTNQTLASYNSYAGYSVGDMASLDMTNSTANDNPSYGVLLKNNCKVSLIADNWICRNSQGIGIETSYLWNMTGTQHITNNSVVGIALRFHSAMRNSASISYSSNGINLAVNPDSWSL